MIVNINKIIEDEDIHEVTNLLEDSEDLHAIKSTEKLTRLSIGPYIS